MNKRISRSVLRIITTSSLLSLAGCGENPYKDFPTPITDSLKMTFSYDGLDFLKDGIGEVQLARTTDGDTADFYPIAKAGQGDSVFSVRFNGVNTPESTALIQPWGQPASAWTKKKLENAHKIVLANDPTAYGQKDGTGRYLGFIWYQESANSDFRLINLELIEQAYGFNLLFTNSEFNYLDHFTRAAAKAKSDGKRIHGEKDPGFDYSNKEFVPNIRSIREQFEQYGMSSSGSTGKKLKMTGVVVGKMVNNVVIRDMYNPYDNGEYSSIYTFAGYGNILSRFVSLGDIVQFECRADQYRGSVQLTDIKTESFDVLIGYNETKYAIDQEKTILEMLDTNGQPTQELNNKLAVIQKELNIKETLVYSTNYYDRKGSYANYRLQDEFKSDDGLFIETTVQIREGTEEEILRDPGVLSSDKCSKYDEGNARYYASPTSYVEGNSIGDIKVNNAISLNLRYPNGIENENSYTTVFKPGSILKIRGYLSSEDGIFSIQLFDNSSLGPCYPLVEVIS